MGHKTSFTRTPGGFILPVVIVLSLAITTVSALALRTIASTSTGLDDQYYTTLAREAAQAGLASATACIKAGTSAWTDTAPLTPNSNCAGVVAPTGLNHVVKDGAWDSTYRVGAPTSTAGVVTITSVGTVTLRTVTGATLKTYTQSVKSSSTTTTSTRVSKPISDVATGVNHACAVASGQAYCWGSNSSGQLGTGNTTASTTPVAVATNSSPIAPIEAQPSGCGSYFKPCTTPATPEQPPSPLANKTVVSISASSSYTCALAYPTGGSVSETRGYCWGYNADGQLGINNRTTQLAPARLYESSSPVSALYNKRLSDITAGVRHTCAVSEGKAYCWGNNENGQIGDDSIEAVMKSSDPSPPIPSVLTAQYRDGCLSYNTWADQLGRVGTDPTFNIPDVLTPKAVYTSGALNGKTVSSVRPTETSTAAVADGQAYWWGGSQIAMEFVWARYPPLYGTERKECHYVSESPENPNTSGGWSGTVWVDYFAEYTFTRGELRAIDTPQGPIFTDTPANKPFLQLSGNLVTGTACALANDRNLYCRGRYPSEYHGQLGDRVAHSASSATKTVAAYMNGALSGKTVTKVASSPGGNYSCAIANQAVYCWGRNTNGRLGTNDATDRNEPTATDVSGPLGQTGGTSISKPIVF